MRMLSLLATALFLFACGSPQRPDTTVEDPDPRGPLNPPGPTPSETAEVHMHHVMSKLDARSRAEVAAWVVTHHLSAPAR